MHVCNVSWSFQSRPPFLTSTIPNTCPLYLVHIQPIESNQCCPYAHSCGAVHQGINNLPVAIFLRKSNSSPNQSIQQLLSLGWSLMRYCHLCHPEIWTHVTPQVHYLFFFLINSPYRMNLSHNSNIFSVGVFCIKFSHSSWKKQLKNTSNFLHIAIATLSYRLLVGHTYYLKFSFTSGIKIMMKKLTSLDDCV